MPLTLPINMKARRWSVAKHSGDTFAEDDDFDGIALTIEIHSAEEAREVAAALFGAGGPGPGPDEPDFLPVHHPDAMKETHR